MGEKSLTGFLKVIGFRDNVEKGESTTTAILQKHCYKTALVRGGLLLYCMEQQRMLVVLFILIFWFVGP